MPSEQEQLWLDVVIETGDPKKAVLIAYPNCGKQAANPEEVIRSRASQLKSKLRNEYRLGNTQALTDAVKEGKITSKDAAKIKSESRIPPLER